MLLRRGCILYAQDVIFYLSDKLVEVYIKELLEKIRAGALVCTSNQRLARHILVSYDSLMLFEGRSTWRTPQVIVLSAWLTNLLTEDALGSIAQPILTKSRARVLFEEVVSIEADLSMEAPYKSALVRDSFDAYLLLKEHNAELTGSNFYLTKEALALKRWSAAYEKLLKEKGFICPSQMYPFVTERIERGEIKLQGEVVLAGFEDTSPALTSLITSIKAGGVPLSFWPGGSGAEGGALEGLIEGVELYAYPEMRDEVVQAARWAREKASEGKKTGIIVTNLSQYKELIEREFSLELTPASALLDNVGAISETFNISMAASISNSQIVKSAIDLLTITRADRPMETELVWEIFSSPYLNISREEYLGFAALDAKLRRFNRSEISLNALSTLDGEGLKGFKQRVQRYIDALKKKTNGQLKERPSAWAGRFSAELTAFGWPGSIAELTSREFQAYEAFTELFAEFASLDDIIALVNRGEAASRVRRMAEASTHQPKSPETLIEVIGLSDSIGFEFDAVRIIGACADVLPPGIDPNPFIPIGMQRELNFTHASPELEAKRAKERLTRLLDVASEVVVSYPGIIDGREAVVAPFFSTLSGVKRAEQRESNSLKLSVVASSKLEDISPEGMVGFLPEEMEGLKGGTTIIKDQSACPFKAFATHRLGARVVESPEPGLSYMDRGTLLHSALYFFWKEVNDSEALNKLIREDRLVVQIKDSVEDAIKKNKKFFLGEVNYSNLEKERLRKLLLEWLTYEASREPFSVDNLESEDEREVSGLNLKFRVDRVDSIGKLRHVVIDYKTGQCSRNDWFGTRPRDPQMLIYNLDGSKEALAFARVQSEKCKFEAIAESEGMLPGNKGFDKESRLKKSPLLEGIDSFEELKDSWRRVVESLAKDFVDGVNTVYPNDSGGSLACDYSYCELKPFCRIFEAEDVSGAKL